MRMEIKTKWIGDIASPHEDEDYFKLRNLREWHSDTESFLAKNAERILQKLHPFGPLFEEGIISPPSANSAYFLDSCLLENIWHPFIDIFDPRMGHEVKMGGVSQKLDAVEAKIKEKLPFLSNYPYKREKTYQTSRDLDIRAFSSVSDLEKELSIPEAIKDPNNLFEQLKNIGIVGERLSGEPEILHEIEDYFRKAEFYPIIREQIKRILQYVPGVFPENWKSPDSNDKLNPKQQEAYTDIAKNGNQGIRGPIIQKVIELAAEYKNMHKNA